MRILVLTAAWPPAKQPDADHAAHICKRLSERGHEVHVVTTKMPSVKQVPEIEIDAVMESWRWRELPRLVRAARAARPDGLLQIYAAVLYGYCLMITFVPSVLKLLLRRASFVVLMEYVGVDESLGRRQWLARLVGRYKYGTLLTASDAVVALDQTQRERLEILHPGAKKRLVCCPMTPIVSACALLTF